MTKPFAKVRGSATDGRVQNPFYRKNQLKRLQETLADNATEIQGAIKKDTSHRLSEVKIEYWLALQCISEAFNSIDPDKCLAEEYHLANGQDDPDCREPVGIVVIEPSTHAFFYSLVAALVPALVAGNCIIVQTPNSLLKTPRLVVDLVRKSLDIDILDVANQEVADQDINHPHCRVLQNGSDGPSLRDCFTSDPKAPVAAFVERDADVEATAKALIGARFGLQGKSPYAPDIVFVNEWIKKDMLRALVQQSTDFMIDATSLQNRGKMVRSELLKEVEREGQTSVIFSGSSGVIMDVGSRHKVTESCLVVHSVSSMDDAIDVSKRLGSLAAAYVFTTPAMAKYLCQFIDTAVAFVNQIPIKLMYSPIAPENHPPVLDSHGLYHQDLFSRPKPKYLATTTLSEKLSRFAGSSSSHQLEALDQEATKKLQEIVRRKKAGGMGFFNQGIVTGLVLVLTAFASGTGILGYYAVRYWRARA
ncbi:hypothetical protein FZEAL_3889 [Fusarium zealandicum]|uniref:Aldehyde dehydrogenase domain-containing protein n=1 Tax=Fusarium zealandicum TaxID=1053134 RepID=A0A8H4UMT4_9HYPO|nr:hypothetical protein FZEAL_3889 [Fusarium zealandicum]